MNAGITLPMMDRMREASLRSYFAAIGELTSLPGPMPFEGPSIFFDRALKNHVARLLVRTRTGFESIHNDQTNQE